MIHNTVYGGGGKGLEATEYTRTLTSYGWSNGTQTVSAEAVTEDSVIYAAPTDDYVAVAGDCGVVCSSFATGEITFSCDTVPSENITVNIFVVDGGETEVLPPPTLFGVYWDGSVNSAMLRTDDSALFTDPSPAVNNGNGSSPFDNIMPWSGMQRVETTEGGIEVSIPKFWYKWTRDSEVQGDMKFQISNVEREGFFVSPAHADRGDGAGERDVVYVGAYHCASSTYKSTSGVEPQASITRDTARTNISNLGSKYWQFDYAMLWTIQMLYLVEYADWNSQAKIGYGCSDSGSIQNTGICDSMTYHTGTNAVSRTTYGHVRYRYIEDLWANVLDWCDGIYFDGSTANIYCIKNPENFSDTTGGTNVGIRGTSSGCITGYTNPTVSGFEYALFPNSVNGTDYTKYVADRYYYNSSVVVVRVGGGYDQVQFYGLFFSGGYAAFGWNADIGARLMRLP